MTDTQKHIMIIDDDESIRTSLTIVLDQEGYRTVASATASDAFVRLEEQSIDLVMFDIKLPDMGGIDLFMQLKRTYPDMALIAVSEKDADEYNTSLLYHKADACIAKPLNTEELPKQIKSIFERRHLINSKKHAEQKLLYERAMFDTFLENIPDLVYFKDKDARFVRVSKSHADLLNATTDDMIGKSDADIFPEELADIKLKDDLSVIETGTPIINLIERDDTDRWVTSTKLPWYDQTGRIIGMFGMSRDVTQQKTTEIKLKNALHDVKKRNTEISSLLTASQVILKHSKFSDTARMLYYSCKELIGATGGGVILRNEVTGERDIVFLEKNGTNYNLNNKNSLPFQDLRRDLLQKKQVVYKNSFPSKELMYVDSENPIEIENVILAPLKIQGEILGVLTFANKPGGFSNHDVQIVSAFGELAAVSLHNTRILETLRASEERFRVIASSAQDAILMMDREGTISFWNEAAERIFGYSASAAIGEKLYQLITPEHSQDTFRNIFDAAFEKESENEPGKIIEMTALRENGNEFPIELSLAAVEITGDLHAIGIIRDISERKRAEEEIRSSEQQYRSVIDNIGIGVALLSPNLEIITLNNQMKAWFGDIDTTRKPLCYQTFISPPHHEPCSVCPSLRTFQDGKIHTDIVSHDGIRHFKVVSSPIFGQNNEIIAVIEMAEDITERLRIEDEKKKYAENLEHVVAVRTKDLEESLLATKKTRDRINAILKSVAEGIIVTDNENRIILMNRASESLLNVRFRNVKNHPIESAVNNPVLLTRLQATIVQKHDSFTFKLSKEDTTRYLQARVRPIQDIHGDHTGTIISFHDITREHEIDRMKTEFISTAAHELRTPLTSIMGFSEILCTRNDISEEETEKYLGYINKQSMRLANIINDILDISRIESGKGFELNKDEHDINEIIRQVAELFKEQSKQHQFQIDLPDASDTMNIDSEKIEQLFKNIISNAVKYSPDGGEIRIRGMRNEHNYEIEVSDTGIGMTEEQLARIYDKFYRADASNTAIEGTGLGMNIAQQIVEAHGGTITVSSIKGSGTKVSMILPLEQISEPLMTGKEA